jgi:hypothetical protein
MTNVCALLRLKRMSVVSTRRIVSLILASESNGRLAVPSHSSSLMSGRRSAPCGRDLTVVPSLDSLSSDLPSILNCLRPSRQADDNGGWSIECPPFRCRRWRVQPTTSRLKELCIEKSARAAGNRTINILVPSKAKDPAYYTFPQCDGYKESPTGVTCVRLSTIFSNLRVFQRTLN